MIQLHHGDCLEVMRSIPDGSVDAVITDPPYGMNWKTDSSRFSGGASGENRYRQQGRSDWGEIKGDALPFDPTHWLKYPRVVLWGCNHFAAKLPVGTTLVWIKKADHLFGTFLSDAELGWMKGGHGVYAFRKQFPPPSRMKEAGGKCAHPSQKPIDLMIWAMERAKVPIGGTVFDPYMGSGTTAIACLRTSRNFIGCEIDPTHFATAQKRIADEQARTALIPAMEPNGCL